MITSRLPIPIRDKGLIYAHTFLTVYYIPTIYCYLYNNIYLYTFVYCACVFDEFSLCWGSPIVIAVSNPPGSCAWRLLTLIIKNIYLQHTKYMYIMHITPSYYVESTRS